MTEYIVDIGLAAVLILTVVHCARRGLVQTVAGIVAWLLASALALQFCAPLADAVYTDYVEEKVQQKVAQKISSNEDASELVIAAGAAFDKLPDWMLNTAEQVGVDVNGLQAKTNSFVPSANDAAASIERIFLAPVLTAFIKVVLFLLIVMAVSALGRLLFMPIGRLFNKIPVIRQANRALGGVFGILKGAALVSVAAILLRLLSGIIGGEFSQAVQCSKVIPIVAESPFVNGFFG